MSDRFERRLRTAGLCAGPAFALLLYLVNPGGHPPEARRLLAILGLTVAFWVTEAIPLPATALLASSLAIVGGVAPARAVLAPYADPVIFLFTGSFLLAESFRRYGLDRRVTGRLLGRGPLARTPVGRLLGMGGASALVSTCLSNTATAALLTPVAVGTVHGHEDRDGPSARGSAMLLMVAYGASIGGMATLIGTPPNLLVAGYLERLAGVKVGFVGWLLFGAPIAGVLFVLSILWTWLALGIGRETAASPGADTRDARTTGRNGAPDLAIPPADGLEDGERRRGARATMGAFGLAAALWTAPALAALLLGPAAPIVTTLQDRLPEAAVALLCAALLFVTPVSWRRRRFALTWHEGGRVNWGILILFGGGLSLGTLAEQTGIAAWAGAGLRQAGLARTEAGLLFGAIALTILVSEFASNTAAASLLVPLVIAAAEAGGLDPVLPALGVGLAATCGFIFPVSTPPNAIVFGTGLVPLRRMIRAGILLDLSALVVVWGGLLLLRPLLPR